MLRKNYLFAIVAFMTALSPIHGQSYLNLEPPGTTPLIFAPSIVNTEAIEINAVFNASMTELFFTRIIDSSFVLHHTQLIDGSWTTPQPLRMFADSDTRSVAIDPSLTLDGNIMYFLGISPPDYAQGGKPDIYKSEKINGQWQLATKVGYPISTDKYAESYPVVVADGSLYFESDRPGGYGKRDIYRAQYLGNGKFETPVNIGGEINTEATARSTYVAPDESYLITTSTSTDKGAFFVSFKKNDQWQPLTSLNLDEPLSKDWVYYCPYMSPDGKYFFFSKRYSEPPQSGWKGVTKGEVYWVNAVDLLSLPH